MADRLQYEEALGRLEAYKRAQEAIGEALACPPGARPTVILGAAHAVRKARDEAVQTLCEVRRCLATVRRAWEDERNLGEVAGLCRSPATGKGFV